MPKRKTYAPRYAWPSTKPKRASRLREALIQLIALGFELFGLLAALAVLSLVAYMLAELVRRAVPLL